MSMCKEANSVSGNPCFIRIKNKQEYDCVKNGKKKHTNFDVETYAKYRY